MEWYSSASIDVKTSSPDPVDIATTRLLFHRHITTGQLRYANGRTTIARTARATAYGPQIYGSSRKKQDG
jgi:hypothetical protein